VQTMNRGIRIIVACTIVALFAAGPALADKPSKNERGDNRDKHEKSDRKHGDKHSQSQDNAAPKHKQFFDDRQRTAANTYYSEEFRRGRCPPGLAKKNNGCLPPGQARKWAVGQPLPRTVVYHQVPAALVQQFDRPPTGYRYVRVADDILLMSPKTGMIIDAIMNIGRRS
jgi:Ni/Co efflux regulator RcnB